MAIRLAGAGIFVADPGLRSAPVTPNAGALTLSERRGSLEYLT